MIYRGAEYTVAQDVGRDTWRWTVNLNEHTFESGQRNSRESALAAVVMTVDRWMMRNNDGCNGLKPTIEPSPPI
jgi:hypothetical protein